MSKITRREENSLEHGRGADEGVCRKGSWKDGPLMVGGLECQ